MLQEVRLHCFDAPRLDFISLTSLLSFIFVIRWKIKSTKAGNWTCFKQQLEEKMKELHDELKEMIKCENALTNSQEYGVLMHGAIRTTTTIIDDAAECHIGKEVISNSSISICII